MTMKLARVRTSQEAQTLSPFHGDAELVQRALAAPQAFDPIVQRYFPMVFAVAYAHVRDGETAEELAQEVFLRAYLHLTGLREPQALAAWLNRITRHTAIRWNERRQTRSRLLPMVPLDNLPPDQEDHRSPSPREQAEARLEEQRLREAIQSLPADQRALVLQHFMEDLSKSEIARRLGLHPSSVGRQLERALAALRQALGETPEGARSSLPRPSGQALVRTSAILAAVAALSPSAKAALVNAAADTAALGVIGLSSTGAAGGGSWTGALGAKGKLLAWGMAGVSALSLGSWVVLHKETKSTVPLPREVPPGRVISSGGPGRALRPPMPAPRTAGTAAVAALPVSTTETSLPVSGAFLPTTTSIATLEEPEKPFFLQGRVVDEEGHPLDGVLVDAQSWIKGNEVLTDRQGNFRLEKLHPTFDFRFLKDGYTPLYLGRQPLGTMKEPVVLGTGTVLEGTVYGPDGSPVAGAQIRADQGKEDQGHGVISEVYTDGTSSRDGRYRLDLKADNYDIQVRAGSNVARLTNVSVPSGKVVHQDIHLTPGVTFRARTVDSLTSLPLPGVHLSNRDHPGIEGTSDEEGRLVIEGMAPGPFKFSVEKDGYCRWWTGEPVRLVNVYVADSPELYWQGNYDELTFDMQNGMEPVTIVLEQGARIRGRVLDPEDRPVAGATVAPALTGTGNSITGDTRFSVRTDESGRFDMTLPASKEVQYNLVAHDGKFGQWRTWANGVLPPIQTKPGEELENVILRLTRPAAVKGKVIDAQGQPVPRHEVGAQARDKLGNRYYDPTTRTDAEGNFELRFVRAGGQYIHAPVYMRAEQAPEGSSILLSLKEGETTSGIVLRVGNR